MSLLREQRYLIIGGVPKSGTTSVFNYLSDHPEACPANRKETYFFAREYDYKKVCSTEMTKEGFHKYFTHCNSTEKLRVEATPYTLYSENSAYIINSVLPGSLMLFILRNPIQRLLSDYRMHLTRGHPSIRGSVTDFIDYQKRIDIYGKVPSLIRLGCYVDYLRTFVNVFGLERIYIMFFEELFRDPVAEMKKLCNSINIDNSFFSTYDFHIHNPTITPRYSSLSKISMSLEPAIARWKSSLIKYPVFYGIFHSVIDFSKNIYFKVNNNRREQRVEFPLDVVTWLTEYYKPYNLLLSEELGRLLPW